MARKAKELTNLNNDTNKKLKSSNITSNKKKVSKTTASVKKSTKKNTSIKKSNKKSPKTIVLPEYYDLPLKYNKTIVKILSQTPKRLFVYWEVSDEDKKIFINTYGNNFFDATYPVLKVYNKTKNYNFEVNINDFANCWYLGIEDEKCEYEIVLCRKFKTNSNNINYLDIASSNTIETPNGHILFDKKQETVYFKNTKTNEIQAKNIASLNFIKYIGKVYKTEDIYKKLYKNENIVDLNDCFTHNPTSTFI